MKHYAILAGITFLALAGFIATVRYDLAMLAWRQGSDRLRAGDYRGAAANFRRAADRIPQPFPILFNEGVALYRLGEFHQARSRFAAASAATEPALRGAARYNLGNCAFRLGERLAATDRQGAHRHFQEAAAEYEQALAITPGAGDARHNLAVVRARLAGSAAGKGKDQRNGAQTSGIAPTGNGSAGKGKGEDERQDGESSAAREKDIGKERANRSRSGKPDSPVHSGKALTKLTRDQAEHLLNEARGREALSAALPAKGGIGRAARPDKDW